MKPCVATTREMQPAVGGPQLGKTREGKGKAVQADQLVVRNQRPNRRRSWSFLTGSIATVLFVQAFLAGAMLSGFAWAPTAHRATAGFLIAATLTAGVVAITTLRRVGRGPGLGLMLLSLAMLEIIQTAIGRLSAEGANLMWIHIPLGVALVGFAAGSVTTARRLGGE